MNVQIIEDKLEEIEDSNYASIIRLIIEAIRDYPLTDLNDTDDYFIEVKRLLNIDALTFKNLELGIHDLKNETNPPIENKTWVISSLDGLKESFSLMELYKIEFADILNKIQS